MKNVIYYDSYKKVAYDHIVRKTITTSKTITSDVDTKDALAVEAKRHEWQFCKTPTPEEYKTMLHKVKLLNVDAAIGRFFGDIKMRFFPDENGELKFALIADIKE